MAAGVFALIAILEAFALLLLTPLKTVTTLPVLVDRQTGFVQTLKPDGRQELQANAALTQSLHAQYVVARESFDVTDISAEYRKVALWSTGAARRDYLALMPASNPASPLRRYPRTALVETQVKSVSPLGPHTALVRFETRRRDADVQAAQPLAWAAVIDYRFSNEPLSVSDRLLNPLGFQVVSYRRDAEAPMPSDTPAEAAPQAVQAPNPTTAAALAPATAPTASTTPQRAFKLPPEPASAPAASAPARTEGAIFHRPGL
jgi:type IV secretion system protein VirB8